MNCPICFSNSYLWGIRQGYRIYSCCKCRHGYLSLEKGDDTLIQRSYQGIKSSKIIPYEPHEYYERMCLSEQPGRQTFTTTQMALKVIRNKFTNIKDRGISLLEVGSCTGYLLQEFQKIGVDAIGIEPGEWGQIAAKERGVKIIQGYLNENSFSQKFDVVVAMDVLEHTIDPIFFLKVLKTYMKPNGILLLNFPNKESFQAKLLGVKWSMVIPIVHIHFFTLKSIEIALKECNLKIVETYCFENTGIPYQFPVSYLRQIPKLLSFSKFLLNQLNLGDQRFVCAQFMFEN